MKIFVAIFITCLASNINANVFSHQGASPRFILKISKTTLDYKSEVFQKTLTIRDCNRSLILELNGSLISLLSVSQAKKGIPFKLDQKTFHIEPNSKLAQKISDMDLAITSLLLEEKRLCK